jgi:hypothetical protein
MLKQVQHDIIADVFNFATTWEGRIQETKTFEQNGYP